MISDAAIAALCVAIFDARQSVAWDHFDDGSDDGVCWGAKWFGGVLMVINRGSKTDLDWIRDAEALADPFVHDELGPVHPGFFGGLERQRDEVLRLGKAFYRFGGHSLGAARASLLTGLFQLAGQMPLPRCVMGEPCSTFDQGAAIIAKAGGTSYRNGNGIIHDPVTLVPVRFWPELYIHATQLTEICVPPDSNASNPFEWHHGVLYQKGIEGLG